MNIAQKQETVSGGQISGCSKATRESTIQSKLAINEVNYQKFICPGETVIHIAVNEKKVAISELEWLLIRKGYSESESTWLATSLSICLTLLFAFICLLVTATFENNGRISWPSVLAVTAHGAGFVSFGLLSIYFLYEKRKIRKDLAGRRIKGKIDHEFGIDDE